MMQMLCIEHRALQNAFMFPACQNFDLAGWACVAVTGLQPACTSTNKKFVHSFSDTMYFVPNVSVLVTILCL